jgi:hypothetical protein
VIVRVKVVDAVALAWSVAVKVIEPVKGPVGVPVITPSAVKMMPTGISDGVDQEYGGRPPMASVVAVYELPAVPVGRVLVVIAMVAIEHVSVAEACWPELSATVTAKVYGPGRVAVPVRRPSAARIKPGGSEPEASDQV